MFALRIPYSSIAGILTANAFVCYLAITHQWNISMLLWTYWGQSVLVGVLHVLCIFFGIYKKIKKEDAFSKGEERFKILFFMAHYGFFHLLYALFLVGFGEEVMLPQGYQIQEVLIGVLSFAITYALSLLRMYFGGQELLSSDGSLYIIPYIRIIPIHITIIFTTVFPMLYPFIILKTFADILGEEVGYRLAKGLL